MVIWPCFYTLYFWNWVHTFQLSLQQYSKLMHRIMPRGNILCSTSGTRAEREFPDYEPWFDHQESKWTWSEWPTQRSQWPSEIIRKFDSQQPCILWKMTNTFQIIRGSPRRDGIYINYHTPVAVDVFKNKGNLKKQQQQQILAAPSSSGTL